MASSSTHYALVNAGSIPLLLAGHDPGSSSDSSSRHPSEDPRQSLSHLYQQYAEMYPNPRLAEEYRLQDELLRATSAAASAQSQQAPKRQRGFFARLFGAADADDSNEDRNSLQISTPVESPLLYTDMPNEDDDGSMCGTTENLDRSCIPLEAYSVARFHLTSQRMREEHPNAVRWGPLLGRSVPTSLIIIGLGVIAEMQPNKESTIQHTSDRKALLDYSRTRPGEFQLEYVRACGISPNCIAVSWGFQEGFISIYRRMEFPDSKECGWEQLWIVQPSPAVLDAIGDVFHEEGSYPTSPLLRIVEMLPLRVTTGNRQQPMVATLAIARLGACLELLPVPTDLWFGPLLTPENHKRPREPKRKKGQHYAFGKYIGSPAVALTTAEQQVDILSMDALRTTVGLDSEWNRETYPSGPPSEFIVAISGQSATTPGHECISFWAVSTLISDTQDANRPVDFKLHANLLDTALVTSGADISIFAGPEIMKHWRTPRYVQLKPDARDNPHSTTEVEETDPETHEGRVTTISTPAPIISMHFLDQKGTALLAMVDWNGGATILDCGPMERTAAQSLSWEEMARMELIAEEGKPWHPLCRTLVSRAHMSTTIRRRAEISTLQWLKLASDNTALSRCPLLLLLRNPRSLLVVTFELKNEQKEIKQPNGTVVSVPFPGQGSIIGDLGSGNLLFIAKRRKGDGSTLLSLFVMENLEPTAIVESLAREHKYEEAISTAQGLDDLDQATLAEVIEECHRRIWESKRIIDHLADTRNVEYIVEQALLYCHSASELDLSLNQLRILCQLAITMGRNHNPVAEKLDRLASFLVKMGTFELLCKCFSVVPHLKKYRNLFQNAPVKELACQAAARGDIQALSILCFRHRAEILDGIYKVLNGLPLSIHPRSFIHLLPVIKNQRILDQFLSSVGINELHHLSHFPQFVKENHGVSVVIDKADEKLVLEQILRIHQDLHVGVLTNDSSKWFGDRSMKVQDFLGDLESVIAVCKAGLHCNGFEVGPASQPPAKLHGIYKTLRGATSLQKMMVEGIVDSDEGANGPASGIKFVRTDDIMSMGLPELTDFVLNGEQDPTRIFELCASNLQPLLLELYMDGNESDSSTNSSLTSSCKRMSSRCIDLSKDELSNDNELILAVAKTLGACAAVARLSNTSIVKRNRLVPEKRELIEMVLTAIRNVSASVEDALCPPTVQACLIDVMWSMYESLPDKIPKSMDSSKEYMPLLEEVECILRDLTCADILARWPSTKPFAHISGGISGGRTFDRDKGAEVIQILCKAFMVELRRWKANNLRSKLLQDLLSDVMQIGSSCCQEPLDISDLLCKNLVAALLQAEQFSLIVEYYMSDPRLAHLERVKQLVMSYVDEAVFSDSSSNTEVVSAMKCHDIIGAAIPEIQNEFASIRRYLDAAHFIYTVIYEAKAEYVASPAELRKQAPIDVIESILRDKPESIICGCPQWLDASFSLFANQTLRMVASQRSPDTQEVETPVLPGGAIFHLATVLGLEDENSALAVKCRAIHFAITSAMHGAAAAICRLLLYGATEGSASSTAVSLAKLKAVEEVVSNESYNDIETKKELCEMLILNHSNSVEVTCSDLYGKVCSISAVLDHRLSRHSREQHISRERLERLLSRPFSRLHQHTLSEYNADMHALVTDLINQTSNGAVHDSLMNALSRFVIYWCISDCKMPRNQLNVSGKNDAIDNIALGCSLILQIPSLLTAKNCVHELEKIMADQVANVATEERLGVSKILVPNPHFVSQLVSRGYTENAARRAVSMTQNAGYNEALRWAVAHSLDSNFNEPIFHIRDPRRQYIDEGAIRRLQKSLHMLQSILEDETQLRGLLSGLGVNEASAISPSRSALTQAGAPAHKRMPRPADFLTGSEIQEFKQQAPSVTFKASTSTDDSEPPTAKKVIEQNAGSLHVGVEPAKPAIWGLSRPPPRETATVASKLPSRLACSNTPDVSSLPKAKSPVDAKYPSRLSSPRDGTRSELFQRGHTAISQRRANGETPDRSKLIAEGRELLRKARDAKVPANSSIPSPTSRAAQTSNLHQKKTNGIATSAEPAGLRDSQSLDETNDASGWDFENFDDM